MPHSRNGLWEGGPSTPTRCLHLWGTQACWLLLIEVCSLTHTLPTHTPTVKSPQQALSSALYAPPLVCYLQARAAHLQGPSPWVRICILTG